LVKVACVLIPHSRVQVERRDRATLHGLPLIITHSPAGRPTVLDYSTEATGVQPGMPLAEALARCPRAALIEPDHSRYVAAFDTLIEGLEGVSPIVEPAPPDAAYVRVDGLELLYGSEEGILQALHEAIPPDLVAQIGVANVRFPAMMAARAAAPGQSLCLGGGVRTFLAEVPVEVLPASWQTLTRLRGFGLHTLGQVALLPLAALQAQFGPEGRRLWELSHGIDESPLLRRKWEEPVTESLTFPAPVASLEPILLSTEMLLGQAFARPTMRGRGVRVATLQGNVFRNPPFVRRVAFKQPLASKEAAYFVLKSALEKVRLPGPLEDLSLTLTGLTGEAVQQVSYLTEVRRREQLREAVQHLKVCLGGKAPLYQIRMVEPWSRIPERRMALVEYVP